MTSKLHRSMGSPLLYPGLPGPKVTQAQPPCPPSSGCRPCPERAERATRGHPSRLSEHSGRCAARSGRPCLPRQPPAIFTPNPRRFHITAMHFSSPLPWRNKKRRSGPHFALLPTHTFTFHLFAVSD